MNDLRELLGDADPLRQESEKPFSRRAAVRQAVLAAAHSSRAPTGGKRRSRTGFFAVSAVIVIAAVALAVVLWSPFDSNALAAIQFEASVADSKPAPGLRKAQVAGTRGYVYVHDKVIVNNNDIAAVHAVQNGGPSRYAISIQFTAAGAKKMLQATQDHVGQRLAILLDGQVMMAPVIRGPIDASAEITGHFTKPEAEKLARRIVKGIGRR